MLSEGRVRETASLGSAIRNGAVFAAQKTGGMKGFDRIRFGADLQVLADVNKRRYVRIQRAQRA